MLLSKFISWRIDHSTSMLKKRSKRPIRAKHSRSKNEKALGWDAALKGHDWLALIFNGLCLFYQQVHFEMLARPTPTDGEWWIQCARSRVTFFPTHNSQRGGRDRRTRFEVGQRRMVKKLLIRRTEPGDKRKARRRAQKAKEHQYMLPGT